jgi:hypothetical protein
MLLEKGDSLTVRNIVLMAAPALDYNPRRIKQFINLFRLKAYIAYETGLFRRPRAGSPHTGLTLEQLGKFVAVGLRWPRLLADLDDANGENQIADDQGVTFWRERPELMSLLKFGLEDGPDPFDKDRPADPGRYSLAGLDVSKLLQVSPRARRGAVAEPPTGATANVSRVTANTAPTGTGTTTTSVGADEAVEAVEAVEQGAAVVEQTEAPPS